MDTTPTDPDAEPVPPTPEPEPDLADMDRLNELAAGDALAEFFVKIA